MAGPPNLTYGQVPTAGQWNQYFATKQDSLGYTPVNRAGDTMFGKLNAIASSSDGAGFNLLPGTPPTSPIDGDVWATIDGLYAQIAGTTIGPIRNGNVAGPSVSVVGHIAIFDDTTGSALDDGGVLGTSATHAASDFVQVAPQTLSSPEIAQVQSNIGLDAAGIITMLQNIAATLPTVSPTSTGVLWINGGNFAISVNNP